MVNGVSALTGLPVRQSICNRAVRRFSIQLGGEAVRIGQALGFDLERIGRFEPEDLARAAEGDTDAMAEVEERLTKARASRTRAPTSSDRRWRRTC